MKGFFLGLTITILSTMNASIGSQYLYFAPALILRAPRVMVRHPVPISAPLKPLSLLKIKDVDHAWRIGHWWADAYNFYHHQVDLENSRFEAVDVKRYNLRIAMSGLYRRLEKADHSINLVSLEDLLSSDYKLMRSIGSLCTVNKRLENVKSEEPWNEAVRLAGILRALPRDKSKKVIVSLLEGAEAGKPITCYVDYHTGAYRKGLPYFTPVEYLREERVATRSDVLISTNFKPLELSEIKDVDDAWRIAHHLADAFNFYQWEIDEDSKRFTDLERKSDLIREALYNIYRGLRKSAPSKNLEGLMAFIFNDPFLLSNLSYFFLADRTLNNICPEEPWREAVRLAKLFSSL